MNEDKNQTLFHIKQNIKCEIPSVVAVLLLPTTMIIFANSKTGVFVGICLLIMILYGIYNIYKILYGKELSIDATTIIYKNFDKVDKITMEQVIDIEIKRGFLNSLCNTETFILHLENKDISLVNVSNTKQVQEYLKTKKG